MSTESLISILQSLKQQGLSPLDAIRSALSQPQSQSRALGSTEDSTTVAEAVIEVFSPLTATQLATILHSLYPAMTALEVGTTILSPKVLPATAATEMTEALTKAGFSAESVSDAVNILYPVAVTIQANQAWQSTGVTVTGRQITLITAEGSWTANPATGKVGPAGNTSYRAKEGYTLPGAFEGALIGRLGNNAPFLVGPQVKVPAGQSGLLLLCINDDINGIYGAGLKDNQGSLQVKIETQSE
ncbi:hypothetical protein [Pseudomonas sp. 3HC3]|uniref:hypothetical protein n=1 Tax=Pseudomonas sp. 3HC3 TaxID=2781025 RepID=UPI003844C95C